MVTDKMTREDKRQRMLDDKAKRKEAKTAQKLVTPYFKPKKVTIRNYEDFPNGSDD